MSEELTADLAADMLHSIATSKPMSKKTTSDILRCADMIDMLDAENSHLRARLAKAEEVMKPFAQGSIDVSHTAVCGVTPANLEAARAFLSEKEEGHE